MQTSEVGKSVELTIELAIWTKRIFLKVGSKAAICLPQAHVDARVAAGDSNTPKGQISNYRDLEIFLE